MHLSGFSTLQQRSGEIKVHWSFSGFFFFFFGWWRWRRRRRRGGVTTFSSNAVVFQQEAAADLTRRSGNDAIMEMNASKSQQLISFTSPFVWPFGRGRGAGTACKDDAERNIISRGGEEGGGGGYQPPFLSVFTKSGHIAEPEKHTLDFLNRQKKAKVATVKLKCPWVSKLTWQGGRRLGSSRRVNEPNGCVSSEQRLSPPSREPGRATSKHMKSTRRRKLSLFKSEPLQDFTTVLSGTTRNCQADPSTDTFPVRPSKIKASPACLYGFFSPLKLESLECLVWIKKLFPCEHTHKHRRKLMLLVS